MNLTPTLMHSQEFSFTAFKVFVWRVFEADFEGTEVRSPGRHALRKLATSCRGQFVTTRSSGVFGFPSGPTELIE